MRQLKRILQLRSLAWRNQQSPLIEIVDAFKSELHVGSGSSIGYWLMHQRICSSYGLVADRETARLIMKALDPDGVQRFSKNLLIRANIRPMDQTSSGTSMATINLSLLGFVFTVPSMVLAVASCSLR